MNQKPNQSLSRNLADVVILLGYRALVRFIVQNIQFYCHPVSQKTLALDVSQIVIHITA